MRADTVAVEASLPPPRMVLSYADSNGAKGGDRNDAARFPSHGATVDDCPHEDYSGHKHDILDHFWVLFCGGEDAEHQALARWDEDFAPQELLQKEMHTAAPASVRKFTSCSANDLVTPAVFDDRIAPAVFEYNAAQRRVRTILQAVRAIDDARMARAACHSALEGGAPPPPQLQWLDGNGGAGDDRRQESSSPPTEQQLRALRAEANDSCARWRMRALEAEAQSLTEGLLAVDAAARSAALLRRSVSGTEAESLVVAKTDLACSLVVALQKTDLACSLLQAMHRGRAARRKLGITTPPSHREHGDAWSVGQWPSRPRWPDPPVVLSVEIIQ